MRLVQGNPVLAGAGLLAGILVVVVTAISINLNFGLPANLNLGWPPSFDYTLSAVFDDANGLGHGADVVIAGAEVGQVTSVQATGTRALATMRIDHQYAPLHKGTIARIRYSTLLAQKYIELAPAAGSDPLPSGARIPSTSTITPVDFDQFLSTLDPETRQRLQAVVQQAGGGVQGEQDAINSLLDNLGHLAVESRAGLSTLHEHDPDLASITTNLDTVSTRLAQSRDNLGGFVQNTEVVNGTLAGNDQDLSGLIYHLANTMYDFNTTLNGEEGNFHTSVVTLDPMLTQLNGTLTTTYPYLHNNLGALQTGLNVLVPEIESAVHERDANGNYLRQFLVGDPCWDSVDQQKSTPPNCAAPQQQAAAPAPPAALPTPTPKPAALCPKVSPLPTPPKPPTPVPTIAPCPTPLPPCVPIPGVPTPTPIPTPSPGSCIPVPGAINPPGVQLPLPTPSLPGVVTGLVGGGL